MNQDISHTGQYDIGNISIVTAFYDIGRGSWTPEKGLPAYLHRTSDTYFERFSYLAQLENEITVVSDDPDLMEKVYGVRKGKEDRTHFVCYSLENFKQTRKKIEAIQKSEAFQRVVFPAQKKNPEYWNPDYVLVTDLKAHFVEIALERQKMLNDLVAWIDFGYCRSEQNIPATKVWNYNFDPEKWHLFSYHDVRNDALDYIVGSNDVHILGAKAVGHKKNWPKYADLMKEAQDLLFAHNMVDDDQTLFLLVSEKYPELCQKHLIPDHQKGYDPFVLFNEFNNSK